MNKDYENISNRKYHRLTAINKVNSINGRTYWLCRCDCGKEKVILKERLKNGQTKSCGCLKTGPKRDDSIIGKTFGQLYVIDYVETSIHRLSKYKVRCSCGNEFIALKRRIIHESQCDLCNYKQKEKSTKNVPNWYFHSLKNGAKARNLNFNITIEDLQEIWDNQSGLCVFTGRKLSFNKNGKERQFQTASIDRINSELGYIKTNIQWVFKDLNYMKQDLDNEEFIQICLEISEYVKTRSPCNKN